VECGYWFTVAIKTDGSLWATGANNYGQLGLGDYSERTVFTQVGSDENWYQACAGYFHMLAIKTDGTMYATGRNNYGQLGLEDKTTRNELTEITSSLIVGSDDEISTWLYVVCGAYHTLAFGSYTQTSTIEPPEDDEPQVWPM